MNVSAFGDCLFLFLFLFLFPWRKVEKVEKVERLERWKDSVQINYQDSHSK